MTKKVFALCCGFSAVVLFIRTTLVMFDFIEFTEYDSRSAFFGASLFMFYQALEWWEES